MRSDPGRFMRLLHFKSHLCIRNLPKCDHLGMLKVKSKWGGDFIFLKMKSQISQTVTYVTCQVFLQHWCLLQFQLCYLILQSLC